MAVDRHVQVAAQEFLVVETAGFAPEQDCDRSSARASVRQPCRQIGGGSEGQGDATLPGAGAGDDAAVGDGVLQLVENPRRIQHIGGGSGAPLGLRIREAFRIDQGQVSEAHRLHGAGDAADIARVARFHQHDANVLGAKGGIGGALGV